jgi:hypothetical protein
MRTIFLFDNVRKQIYGNNLKQKKKGYGYYCIKRHEFLWSPVFVMKSQCLHNNTKYNPYGSNGVNKSQNIIEFYNI